MKLLRLTAFAMSIVLCHAAQADLIYGVDSDGDRLVTIDSETFALSIVGSLSVQPIAITGLAFSPSGELFGLDFISGNLFSINHVDASIALVGASGFSSVDGLAIDSFGNAFSVSRNSNELLSIDLTTGAATVIGEHHQSLVAGLEFDNNDVLYGVNPLTDELLMIDTATGGITSSVSLSDDAQALGFDSSNNLFSVDNGNPEGFLSLDPVTGTVTRLGSLSIESISDLAVQKSAAVPEPSSLALLLCGLASVTCWRRRRKRNA